MGRIELNITTLPSRDLGQTAGQFDDPLASRIILLEGVQAQRAGVIFDDNSVPDNTGIRKRLDLLNIYQRDEAILSNLKLKQLASRTLTESLQLFFDDMSIGYEVKLPLLSANIEILQLQDDSIPIDLSEEGIYPEQILALEEVCRILEKEEIKDGYQKDQYQAFRQYIEYFLWRIGQRKVLPELSERLMTSSLYEQLPEEIVRFHTVTLPKVWLTLLEERENSGQFVSVSDWHRFNREKTRRELLMSLSSDPALEIIVPGNNSELMRLRREYAATAELLGIEIKDSIDATGQTFPELSMPDLDQILDYLYKEMRRIMGDRDAINLIMGISGDLDSSAQLALLSEVIKRYDLPYKIHAYYLKKDHHNSRFRRITQLINHINSQRESGIVQLHVYEGLYTYELMLQSLVSENSGFVKPNGEVAKQALRLIIAAARDAMEKTGVVGSEAEKRHRKSSGIEKPIDEITKLASLLTSKSTRNQLVNFFRSIGRDNAIVTSGQILNFILELLGDDERLRQSIEEAIDKREQSNLIHEMLVAIRGNLCRRFDYPLTVSAQQLSELTTENYTTSDTFVSWFPLSKIPKTVLAHVFQEYILGSNGGVSLEEWKKFPMKYLVPYYPDFMHVKERNGQKIISRDAWFFPEFNYVKVEHDASGIPVDVWDEIEQVERKNYIKIDGRIQWYLDPYLHYFLINGLSKDTVDYLIQRYPARKTDIHLTAFLLAGAREKRQKDAYMLKTANFR